MRPDTENTTIPKGETSSTTHTGALLKVLAVLTSNRRHSPIAQVWAKRQINSLQALGLDVDHQFMVERRSLWQLIRLGVSLRRHIRRQKPDLVHVHWGSSAALVTVLFSPRPVVVSFCGSDLLGNYNSRGKRTWSGRLSSLLSKLASLKAARIITKTEELKHSLWKLVWDKTDIIPNGVDMEFFAPMPQSEARRRLGWEHNQPAVLFINRDGAWVKDPLLARAAYNRARELAPELKLVWGERLPPEDMPLYYNAADVLLLTSRHEGSNNTIKEALACGLPVVATRCGDVEERLAGVTPGGVCDRSVDELGCKLAEATRSRQRSNGRDQISDLSLEKVALRVLDCYREALR